LHLVHLDTLEVLVLLVVQSLPEDPVALELLADLESQFSQDTPENHLHQSLLLVQLEQIPVDLEDLEVPEHLAYLENLALQQHQLLPLRLQVPELLVGLLDLEVPELLELLETQQHQSLQLHL
jgi:hypothetical protein